MYYPYFRGKQYELIVVRENAQRMKDAGIIPIIEPVKKDLRSLKKAIEPLVKAETPFIIISNPKHGYYAQKTNIHRSDMISELIEKSDEVQIGYILNGKSKIDEFESFCADQSKPISIINFGFPDNATLPPSIGKFPAIKSHIFIERFCGSVYRKQFKGVKSVLVRDGFVKQRNKDYAEIEHFSDLHLTYSSEGADGYGDFLIVGDEYSENGGPAHAVAIHLTYLNPDDMYIKHYISDRTESNEDTPGKFLEALRKLVSDVQKPSSEILKTSAVDVFINLHNKSKFPGLGSVKKLSMQHHIELMEHFLTR